VSIARKSTRGGGVREEGGRSMREGESKHTHARMHMLVRPSTPQCLSTLDPGCSHDLEAVKRRVLPVPCLVRLPELL
jgi:hypothetical protein